MCKCRTGSVSPDDLGEKPEHLPQQTYAWRLTNHIFSLKKAQDDAASLTPEYVAANMAPEEAARLSRVRNIGIAVCLATRRARLTNF